MKGNGNGHKLPADDSFDRWYGLHFDRIRGLCARILRDPVGAEDVAQEAMLRAWMRRDQMRDEDIGAWLSVVARNLCISAMRKDWRSTPTESVPEVLDLDADPAVEVGSLESRRSVRSALARMGERHRKVLYLREVGGADYEELGSEFGLSAAGARTVAFRARRVLREHLTAVGEGFSGILVGVRIRIRDLRMRVKESVREIDALTGSGLQAGMNFALAVGVGLVGFSGGVGGGPVSGRVAPRLAAIAPQAAHQLAGQGGSRASAPFAGVQPQVDGKSPAGPGVLPKPKLDGTPYNYKDGSSHMLFRFGPIGVESQDHRGSPGGDPYDGFEPVYGPIDATFAVLCGNAPPSTCNPFEEDE